MLGSMFIGIACLLFVLYIINNHKERSGNYRKLLTNLYVAGKIREIAKKDGIDLKQEFKEYRKLTYKKNRDIDDAIEDKISDKITKEVEKSE